MDRVYISHIIMKKVRHLSDIQISLSEDCLKHLIITGKNGSGKTSVLDAIASRLGSITGDFTQSETDDKKIGFSQRMSDDGKCGSKEILFNIPLKDVRTLYKDGRIIMAYYNESRSFEADIPNHVEKVAFKNQYSITESPRQDFVKYLVDLKMTEALALTSNKLEKAQKIHCWFKQFENLLKRIFDDSTLSLEFDEEKFSFRILENGREPFDFNTLSSGFAAILDIVVDLMMRMESKNGKSFQYDMTGIVLIDEIETHLHLELQKTVLDMLTTIFPNIQFIVSTHSPFILNSLENAVLYDLENKILVKDGLSNVPYDGIIEGYFNVSMLSQDLMEKYERYKTLTTKKVLSDNDFEEIARLEMYLDEIPDYLSLNITTDYHQWKLKFENREDI